MDEKGQDYEAVMSELKSALARDHHFKDGRVLGSMCTEPNMIAKEVHAMFLEANLGNPGLYPGTAELENELIGMVSELLHGHGAYGMTVSGGTEANITALWIAKKVSRGTEVVYPHSAHFSIQKALDILDLEGREIGLREDFRMDISEVENHISDKTAAVLGIAGTTEFGVVDPVQELGDLCDNTFLHVDAAYGGFVIPFLKELGHDLPPFDLEIEHVDSISVDPHKMGMATIPSGILLMRDEEYLNKITVASPYLTSPRQASLSGTRCSAGAVSAYAVMKFLGREGYRKIVKQCMDTAHYLVGRVRELGLEPIMEPIMPIVCIKLKSAEKVYISLNEMGWKPSITREPKCLRIVVMPHVTRAVVDEFIPDLAQVCGKYKEI
ncbi:MAG: tyrosine decarboxylase MfnA [Thermoplasmata archaeon]|nr:MAG: tyrosine decarboxylase MfnA [Thermoplasmata archaeon]